jgi:hypothetical protein
MDQARLTQIGGPRCLTLSVLPADHGHALDAPVPTPAPSSGDRLDDDGCVGDMPTREDWQYVWSILRNRGDVNGRSVKKARLTEGSHFQV